MHEERSRLADHEARRANWRQWGPYLAERAWGTVREDYSRGGNAWQHFPHDHARSRAYRWNEDGLGGFCDRMQHVCMSVALWNGRDPFLKERLFGLSGPEGNHGEDPKEVWYYLDAVPSHAWQRMLYKYPHARFPYERLIEENGRRARSENGRATPEFELHDTGVFDEGRYHDVEITWAKAGQEDVLLRVRVSNRGPEAAVLHVLPQLWFRNTWDWGYPDGPRGDVPGRPEIRREGQGARVEHPAAGQYDLRAEGPDGPASTWWFTENSSNHARLWGSENPSPFVKDAFHRALCDGEEGAVNPDQVGTKVCAVLRLEVPAGGTREVRVRLSRQASSAPFADFASVCARREAEADAFYEGLHAPHLTDDGRRVQRQALAGMLWSKQLYNYDVQQWLEGDPRIPPPAERKRGRNRGWAHLTNFDVISMPDTWEYPWYATWDLAFHCLPLAMVDVGFAKRQLELFTREWYMHPNGQLPAYEWGFDDVNPPVHAWAVWRVYKMEQKHHGGADRAWLAGVFHKLLLNFTWWVNRKDAEGSNIFQGGFLGLDNIGLFDRSKELPGGGRVDQSDGTSWMAAYSLQMMKIAIELAREEPVYQDLATKFFEHFLRVADAMADLGGTGEGLWDEEDGFYYDVLHLPGRAPFRLRVRSLVGLLPLFASDSIDPVVIRSMPTFARRMRWFMQNRPNVARSIAVADGDGDRFLVSLLTRERLVRVLERMLDEDEFLSDHGIRSLSKVHEREPFTVNIGGVDHRIGYEPAESETGMFGGNSNWRGPVWFPMNHLLIEALQRMHLHYGETLKVRCPSRTGPEMNLGEVADELSRRLCALFLEGPDGQRPFQAGIAPFARDPHFRDHLRFHEYFDGDSGIGRGAEHQTGWTGLVAKLLQRAPGER